MIKLRPHHLLCILTYVGKGYSKPFTENFDAICERINQGERNVEIIKGPDDVCAPRLCDPEDTKCHCYDQDITDSDAKALNDLNLNYGDTLILSPEKITELREGFAQKTIRKACIDCQWYGLCTDVANSDYKDVKLKS
ncbi:MAG: 2Fe-2S ferredoxin [Micavibrio sp.]|nr:2Fe-2S ferredoxin [Micavibrio sp.]HCK33249.1 DUF1284 domain-containing protein [Rhodospirillaceae bacterium]|tara:strand:- start:686 stop:1099 length:414 start_codon:yes stop_codon:yes gene_type:complete